MKKHIYLHASSVELAEVLNQDEKVKKAFEYPLNMRMKIHPNEWGFIETEEAFYHILIGNIRQKNCPWCAGEGKVTKVKEGDHYALDRPSEYAIICKSCGSRGPVIKINEQVLVYESNDYVNAVLWHLYETRALWDNIVKNPYESEPTKSG